MKKSFTLPSEKLSIYQHDCRLDSLKYRHRSKLYDLSVLASLLTKTKTSLDLLYDNYLHHSEDLSKFNQNDEKNNTARKLSSKVNFNHDQSEQNNQLFKKEYTNKIIKELGMNDNNAYYGNIYWPFSICCNQRDEIIVADSFNNRILVFSLEFIFKYQIGRQEEKNSANCDQFDEPCDIILNDSQKLLVADKNNFRIQIFAEIRKFRKAEFDAKNEEPLSSSFEYVFDEIIKLKEKPIKISSSIFTNITAVGCENGFVFIINDSNQIISYLDLNDRNPNHIKNICLNEDGSLLISLNIKEKCLKFYQINAEINEDDDIDSYIRKKRTHYIKELELVERHDLDTKYKPGICLSQASCLKLSQDYKKFFIFDQLNLNLIEYNLKGQFERIILTAEDGLSNVLSFDYSGDREHLVTSEALFNKFKQNTTANSLITSKLSFNQSSNFNKQNQNLIRRSWPYEFRLKVYKYKDCNCHYGDNSKPASRLSSLNRNTYQFSFNITNSSTHN